MNPPCCPPADVDVDVCIWIAIDIHDSWPDSANTLSFGCMFSSSTGMTVPTIFGSIVPPDECAAAASATKCIRSPDCLPSDGRARE